MNEEEGLRKLTLESCDRLVDLPMKGNVEAFKVSTAVSALLNEAARQRAG